MGAGFFSAPPPGQAVPGLGSDIAAQVDKAKYGSLAGNPVLPDDQRRQLTNYEQQISQYRNGQASDNPLLQYLKQLFSQQGNK